MTMSCNVVIVTTMVTCGQLDRCRENKWKEVRLCPRLPLPQLIEGIFYIQHGAKKANFVKEQESLQPMLAYVCSVQGFDLVPEVSGHSFKHPTCGQNLDISQCPNLEMLIQILSLVNVQIW